MLSGTTGGEADGTAGFAHTAVIVDSDRALRAVLVPALRRALDAREAVHLVVGAHTAEVVRDELGARADDVRWGDPRGYYQRLGFAYEGFRRYLADAHAAGRRVHVIAEPDLAGGPGGGTPPDRAAAYLAYEAICNDTYAPYGSPVTCVWDSRHHPRQAIDDARRVHRYELTEAGRVPSPAYVPPHAYLAGRDETPLDDVPAEVEHDLEFADGTRLGRLRAGLRPSIEADGFTGEAADDIILAVTEIATNGLAHGTAPVRLRVWHRGDTLVAQLDDRGGQTLAPDAGYRRPDAGTTPGGRGLWLARQLADSVLTHSEPGRTSVRLHFPREITNRNPA
jgi:anti-sigma regulatory factor (Ser/Thr protein kinase)